MSLSSETLQEALKELGLVVEVSGHHLVHSTRGRYAPVLHTIMTIDEDGDGATLMTSLEETIPSEKRTVVCELLNLVHGQNLWNVRFHLDETGRVFSIGKLMLWGKPFNPVQLGDIFYTSLVTADRLHPCLVAVNEQANSAEQAFESFFMSGKDGSND